MVLFLFSVCLSHVCFIGLLLHSEKLLCVFSFSVSPISHSLSLSVFSLVYIMRNCIVVEQYSSANELVRLNQVINVVK